MKMILMLCIQPMLLVREKGYYYGVMVEVVKLVMKNNRRVNDVRVVMCRQSVKKQSNVHCRGIKRIV